MKVMLEYHTELVDEMDRSGPHELARAFYSLIPVDKCECDCSEYIDFKILLNNQHLAMAIFVEVCKTHEALFNLVAQQGQASQAK